MSIQIRKKAVEVLIANIHIPIGKIFWGNILLIICCVFYLLWWTAAFKPHAAAGMVKTVGLLAFAVITGIAGLTLTVKGVLSISCSRRLLPGSAILWGGVAVYAVLFVLTCFFLKRQVTTELFLIVGWAVLEISVLNVLYGAGHFSAASSVVFFCIVACAVVASLVCYVLYYKLEGNAGYIDGMVPLLLAASVMAGITVKLMC